MDKLKLAVLKSSGELGVKVNERLKEISGSDENYSLDLTECRFSNGEGKVTINEGLENTDLYVLGDVGHYDLSYKMRGHEHLMAPDEHFADIKRVIAAANGHASKVNVVTPLLYESRQHKRRRGESLDCAIALQELDALGVNSITTFDAHDPSVCNAIPRLPFENFYPTHIILDNLLDNEEMERPLIISPDNGAMDRARIYAEMLGCDVGLFYKRRDLTKVVNGKNPIVEHIYMGADPKGKDCLVVDDMIASGSSILEVAENLKERGARNIYLATTFSLFTEGTECFEKSYDKDLFNKVYSTNLSYVPDYIKNSPWFQETDCSKYLAEILTSLHTKENINDLWDVKKHVLKKIEKKRRL